MRRAKGTIHVFTFKDGVLSAVAHDLRIRFERFAITLEGDAVHDEFDLNSLLLDGPVRDDVLHTNEHPTASFTGRASTKDEGFAVSGELALAGRTAPLAFEVSRADD